MKRHWLLLATATLVGCSSGDPNRVQGYVEGEFVYASSPVGGALQKLAVERGRQVAAGDGLFQLETNPEQGARDEALQRLSAAKSTLIDLRKGRRPSEIETLEAERSQAAAALDYSDSEYRRVEKMVAQGAAATEDLEKARSAREQDRERVKRLEAELRTATLGSREDQIAAAESDVRARTAALATAEWNLSQKRQIAGQAALVFDTLYREGEQVPAGRPVVVLLPPRNVKVRTFVSESRVGSLQVGQDVRVSVDGVAEPFTGKISFVSPQAEYTPPVIYSRESRSKLVFMIEIRFEDAAAARLHPGQPVDVQLVPRP